MLDINGDGIVSEREASTVIGNTEANAGSILLRDIEMPANSAFGTFGGRMTSDNCDRAGRPPCDARHPAVDAGRSGDYLNESVYAAAYGTVVMVGYAGDGFGEFVLIEHDVYGVKLYSVYAHNSAALVSEGMVVTAGTRIAWMGDTHNQSSVHLHFEIRTATNVDLGQDQPFADQVYWPSTQQELLDNFVDLGPVFGYHASYESWAGDNP